MKSQKTPKIPISEARESASSTQSLDALRVILCAEVPDDLLHLALTHPSAVGEGMARTLTSNQRLEFLGDTIVGTIVAEHLYRTEAHLPEGDLTQRKAAAVRGESLASAAKRLDLGAFLSLGKGEEQSGGRVRDTILADAFEAVLGAIFLSCGLEKARDFALKALREELDSVESRAVNVKNLLQEKTQAVGLGTPKYQTATRARSGEKRFSSQVLLCDEVRGRGEGKTKKEAEERAARQALDAI